jgi:hypothetical protein
MKIYGPLVKNNNDYALFLKVLKNVQNGLGYFECLSKYRKHKGSLSSDKLKKIGPFIEIMVNHEHKNIFIAFFYLITNSLIKILFKYEKM